MINWEEFYNKKDNQTKMEAPCGWIQWKGTNVCMDISCKCGSQLHIDAEFAYYVKCTDCNTLYSVSPYVKLVKLDAEDIEYFRARNLKAIHVGQEK